MADHSLGAAVYALRAVEAAGGEVAIEQACQIERLPDEVRDLVLSALESGRFRRLSPSKAA
jgi:hypothetical protein